MKYLDLFLAMVSTQIAASEGGGSNYLPGFYGDFAMAVMPQQRGTYFNNFMTAFQDKSGVRRQLSWPGDDNGVARHPYLRPQL